MLSQCSIISERGCGLSPYSHVGKQTNRSRCSKQSVPCTYVPTKLTTAAKQDVCSRWDGQCARLFTSIEPRMAATVVGAVALPDLEPGAVRVAVCTVWVHGPAVGGVVRGVYPVPHRIAGVTCLLAGEPAVWPEHGTLRLVLSHDFVDGIPLRIARVVVEPKI